MAMASSTKKSGPRANNCRNFSAPNWAVVPPAVARVKVDPAVARVKVDPVVGQVKVAPVDGPAKVGPVDDPAKVAPTAVKVAPVELTAKKCGRHS
jgi:hypothetical protein